MPRPWGSSVGGTWSVETDPETKAGGARRGLSRGNLHVSTCRFGIRLGIHQRDCWAGWEWRGCVGGVFPQTSVLARIPLCLHWPGLRVTAHFLRTHCVPSTYITAPLSHSWGVTQQKRRGCFQPSGPLWEKWSKAPSSGGGSVNRARAGFPIYSPSPLPLLPLPCAQLQGM